MSINLVPEDALPKSLFVEAEVNAIAIDVDANQIGPPGRTISSLAPEEVDDRRKVGARRG